MVSAMTTADQPIHYFPTGDIQIRLVGSDPPMLLPRPGFGQIKNLIRARGRFNDAREVAINRAKAAKNDALAAHPEGIEITGDNLDALTALRVQVRAVADVVEEEVAEICEAWWTEVFTLLNGGTVPPVDAWPSVFMDTNLPDAMIDHWRFVPVGPG